MKLIDTLCDYHPPPPYPAQSRPPKRDQSCRGSGNIPCLSTQTPGTSHISRLGQALHFQPKRSIVASNHRILSQSLSVSSSHSDVFCNWTRQRRWRWTIVVAFVATAQLRIWWTGCLLKESLVSLRHCGAPQGASVKSGPQTSWQIGGCSLKATFAGYFESAVSTESVSFSVWLYSHLFTDNRPSPAGTHHT